MSTEWGNTDDQPGPIGAGSQMVVNPLQLSGLAPENIRFIAATK